MESPWLLVSLAAQACRRMDHCRKIVVRCLRQLQPCRGNILFQMHNRGCSRDRQNHRGPLEKPGQSDLQRCCIEFSGDFFYRISRFSSLTKWSPRQEGDVILRAIIDDEVGLAVGKTVSVLHRDNGHDPASTLDVLACDVGESQVANFSLLAQPGQRFNRCLEGDCIVRGMELVNIDSVQAQTLEAASSASVRCLGLALWVHWLGPGLSHPPLVAVTRPVGYGKSASAIRSSEVPGP